jgi:hypothetical protein
LHNTNIPSKSAFDVVHRDVNYRQSHVQRTLLNCALDGVLAASSFHTLASAKQAGPAPLLRAELNIISAGVVESGGRPCSRQSTAHVFRHFTRTWVCAIHPIDDWEGGVLAVEGETRRLVRHPLEVIRGQPLKLGSMDAAFRAV